MEKLSFTSARDKLSYHPKTVSDLLAGKIPIPISMEVDLSYFCGDSCNFCHFAYTHENPPKKNLPIKAQRVFLTPANASQIFQKLATGGVKSVIFSGGGEPLDNPQALQIFELAKQSGLEMGMYTRGYGLRREIADFVAENFSWVVVSLDTTNPEDHKELKGTGERVFNTKVDNIHQFTTRPDRKASISVSLLVNSQHLKEVEPSVTRVERDMLWMLGLGADEIQIRPIVDTGSYQEQRKKREVGGVAFKTDETSWKAHYSWIPPMRKVLSRYKDTPGLNISDDKFDDLYNGVNGWGDCDGMVISAGLVDTEGIVYKCVNLRGITPIGDLTKQSLAEIYSPTLDRTVDALCRAGCRGCKVNQVMYGLRRGQRLSLPNPAVKHPNFI